MTTDPNETSRDPFTVAQLAGCVGCGGVIAAIFALLAWTVVRADERVLSEPQRVEANLQAIVPCAVPAGYRGFRGIDDGQRRIALLTPNDYGGTRVPVDRELTIGVWTFPAQADAGQRLKEVVAFWETMIRERLGHASGALEASAPKPLQLTIAGQARAAELRTYQARKKLRLIVALTTVGGRELGLSFVGLDDGFDEAAMAAFLGSLK